MHHLALERWSRLDSPLHRLDARAKIVITLGVLLSVSFTRPHEIALFAIYFLLLCTASLLARLPWWKVLARGLIVLPFVAGVVILNLAGGEPIRAWAVLARGYLSAVAVLLLLATTTFPKLLRGLESLGVPRFFGMILHFVYRYLFLLVEQAQNMRRASRCRAPQRRRRPLLEAAAGAVAVLFARSYGRAERIHQAMLARGFHGHFKLLETPSVGPRDWVILGAALGFLALMQFLR
ncbi:MAG: energy-coupling factor transporter transmembrane component T [Bryobacterales bacterium]